MLKIVYEGIVCYALCMSAWHVFGSVLFFQAEDGIRDLVRSRGLGDVYKRQHLPAPHLPTASATEPN